MAGTVNDMLRQAHLRLTAALVVSAFGSPAQRELVGQLVDGKLPEDEARQVRDGLDRLAERITG